MTIVVRTHEEFANLPPMQQEGVTGDFIWPSRYAALDGEPNQLWPFGVFKMADEFGRVLRAPTAFEYEAYKDNIWKEMSFDEMVDYHNRPPLTREQHAARLKLVSDKLGRNSVFGATMTYPARYYRKEENVI